MATPDIDVVVAGAGGGLVAALRAAELGLRALVVDADAHFLDGNNTSMCTAMIPAAGTRWQAQAGIEDSPQQFASDIERKTRGTADPRLSWALATTSARLVTWLADSQDLDVELATDIHYPGHSAVRCHTIPGRHGARMLRHLKMRVESSPSIELVAPMALREIHMAGGRVVAVGIETPDGHREKVGVRAVLLATNGFGANGDLVSTWLPEVANVHYHGGQFSRGDALRLGRELGADTGYLDAYQGHAALSSRMQSLVGWATMTHGGVLVDRTGRRFACEAMGYSEFAAILADRPGGTGWIVIDEEIRRRCLVFDDFKAVNDSGSIVSAGSAHELADLINVPGDVLEEELTAASRAAAGLEPDPQGRTDARHAIRPPYAAVAVSPALFHTQGGLMVDDRARVLADGQPIHGLYASGGAAIGISGHGASGYLAGNGLITALGLALLAAEDAGGRQIDVAS